MNQYLIPANSKKSMLIFGLFNVTDLVMFGIGIGITLLLLPVLPINNWIFALIAIAPAAVSGYHPVYRHAYNSAVWHRHHHQLPSCG